MRFLSILILVFMLCFFVGCKDKSDAQSKVNGSGDGGQSQSDQMPVDDRDDDGWSQDII